MFNLDKNNKKKFRESIKYLKRHATFQCCYGGYEIYVKDNVSIVLNNTEVIENTYPIDTDIHFIIKDTLDRIFKWMNTTY